MILNSKDFCDIISSEAIKLGLPYPAKIFLQEDHRCDLANIKIAIEPSAIMDALRDFTGIKSVCFEPRNGGQILEISNFYKTETTNTIHNYIGII